MTDRSDQQLRRQALSDLMDGAADAGAAARACEAWRGDSGIRGDWYAYHVIGDVLRSDDLAHAPARDEAFLAALRGRLAQEPVVFAPQPAVPASEAAPAESLRVVATVPQPRRSLWRRAWVAPSAVAAGVMAVAGVLVVTQMQPTGTDGVQLAAAVPPAGIQPVSIGDASVTPPNAPVRAATVRLIRDAQLDRYLAAHRQYGASSMLPVPAATAVSYGAAPSVPAR